MHVNTGNQLICMTDQVKGLDIGVVSVRYGIGAAASMLPVGCAHFLEHVVCATKGNSVTGSLTAMTKRDETSYSLLIGKEQLLEAFASFQMNQGLELTEDIVERERKIITREIAQHRIQTRNLLLEELQAALFPDHGYGQSILGNMTQLQRISLGDLQKGLSYYDSPRSIIVAGPWEPEQIAEGIRASGIAKQQIPDYPVTYPSVLGRGERKFTAGGGNIPFVAGGWALPVDGLSYSEAFLQMQAIWAHRVRKYNPNKNFQLRLHRYRFAGVLTLDSIGKEADLHDLAALMIELRSPFTKQEYKAGISQTTLKYLRQQEDLLSRVHLETCGFHTVPLSWEELVHHQQMVNPFLYLEMGVYGTHLQITNSSYVQISVPNLLTKTNSREEGMESAALLPTNCEKRTNRSAGITPLISICNSVPGQQYWTLMSSPLTHRFHLLYRVSCLPVGKLLIPKDLPPAILQKGSLESVRYEGWDSLFHVAYNSREQMLEALRTAISVPWPVEEHGERLYSQHFHQNIELELKSRILGAIRPWYANKTLDSSLMTRGVSLVLPLGDTISTEELDKWRLEAEHVEKQSPCVQLVQGAAIEARFNGAAVICRLPHEALASLIIQEAAFGVGGKPFATLESMIRRKGISYRIVQSLCRAGRDIYLFWGVQCTPEMIVVFYDTIKEWLHMLHQSASAVESWFCDNWPPFSPQNHRSILQLLRDTDRMGYYAYPNERRNGELDKYIRRIVDQEMVKISFYQNISN